MSPEIINSVKDVLISAAPLTDHCLIDITLKAGNNSNSRKNYRKFNADLLNVEDFVQKVKDLLAEIKNDTKLDTYCRKWEYFKYKVRSLSVKCGKPRHQLQRENELKLIQEISECCQKFELSEEDKAKMLCLQTRVDNLYIQKAQGAYVRSRAKWIEQGEKNSSYFFGLERRRQEGNKIDLLMINDSKWSDTTLISEEIHRFYSNLYRS